MILGSPERDRLIEQFKSHPIETVIEVCTPANFPANNMFNMP